MTVLLLAIILKYVFRIRFPANIQIDIPFLCRSVWENHTSYRDDRSLIRKKILWSVLYTI